MGERIENLYRDLTAAFPHPFDWMNLLHKPPFWWRRHRKAHNRVASIFERYGFNLTDRVAEDYHRIFPQDWEHYGEDAGCKITRKLARALHGEAEWPPTN